MIEIGSLWPFGRKRRPWHDCYPASVPATLEYPNQPLGWLLEQPAARFPNRVACHYYSQRITYEELLSHARKLGQWLVSNGLQPGDRVGVLLPNLPEYLVTLFGTWMAGGVVVALSPLMVADQVGSFIAAAGCRIVITLDVLSPLLCGAGQGPSVFLLSSLR